MEVAVYAEWIQSDALIDAAGRIFERALLGFLFALGHGLRGALRVPTPSESREPKRACHRRSGLLSSAAGAALSALEDSGIDEILLRDVVNHDPAAFDRLPRLPYSGRELDRVKAMFPRALVLRGSEATEPAVNRLVETGALENYEIVHIASHALVDRSPEHCALVLSRASSTDVAARDGLIDTPEIRMGWKLNAQLVTLSACQTAGVGFNSGGAGRFA